MAVLDRMTREQKRQLAVRMAGMNYPGVRQAWLDDPASAAGQTLLEQGASTDPVAAGGWGWAEGIGRLGSGLAGGLIAGKQFRDYSRESGRRAQLENQGRLGFNAPPGIPPEASANVAMPTNLAGPQSFNASPLPALAQTMSTGQPPNPIQPPVVNRGQVAQAIPTPSTAAPIGRTNRVQSLDAERRRVGDSEGPMNVGGYNALAYNTPDGKNAAGVERVPLTSMTIGQVLDFQRGPMRAKTRGHRGASDVGSTGAGRYQFESNTLEERARKVFGPGYKSVPFNRQNQDALFDSHYAEHKANGTLGSQWNVFKGQGGGGRGEDFPGTPTLTDTSYNPVAVPDLPPEPERPVEPTIDPIRQSPRRLLAEHLMRMATGNDADANALYPVTSELNKLGMEEESDLNKQREENVAQLRSLGYQTDMQTYGSMRGNRYQQQLDERGKAYEANLKGAEGDIEHARNLELEDIRGNQQIAAARARQFKDYDPNDPRIMKMIKPFSDARENAITMANDSNSIMEITANLPSGGYNSLPYYGAARGKYSDDIAQLEMIRKRMASNAVGGKLGGGISNADMALIQGMHPFEIGTPNAAMRRDALILAKIAQRAQMYNQAAIEAIGNGTYSQFEANWGKYTRDTPYMKGKLPVHSIPSYDDYVAGQQ